jgi:hypothetical protein
MAAYVVMEPPARQSEHARDRTVFIRDGFSLLAFLVPPLWLLWHRLWIEAALVFAASVGLGALGEILGLGTAGAALSLLVSLYVGLEGAALRIAALSRRGWADRGVVEADNRDEAEIRYLTAFDAAADDEAVQPAFPVPRRDQLARGSGPALGLFSYPGRS